VIAYVIDQMIGMALLGFFAGLVSADAARPRPRRSRRKGTVVPALPRGICPVCFTDVALHKGGLVREHRYLGGGSGMPARVEPTAEDVGKLKKAREASGSQ
jgi:hypothetical protein